MSFKLIFLLLTALLLVQCSVGKPMPDADTAAEVSKEVEINEECEDDDFSGLISEEKRKEAALFLFIIGEYYEIYDMILNRKKKVVEDVVADVNAMEEKSEALKIKTGQLADFLSILDKFDLKNKKKMGWTFALLDEMDALLDTFNTTATEKPDAENLIIEASLKKHGIEEIMEDALVKLLEFYERFYVVADKYWDSLSPEEQTEHKNFAEWLKLFKEETNLLEKLKLFQKIYKLDL